MDRSKAFHLHTFALLALACIFWPHSCAQDPNTIHTCHNYTNLVYFYEVEFPAELITDNAKTRFRYLSSTQIISRFPGRGFQVSFRDFRLQRQNIDLGCSNRLAATSTVGNALDSKSRTEFKFDPTGALRFGVNSFRVDEYCVQGYDGVSVSVRICNPCPMGAKTSEFSTALCVPKCCAGFSQVYDSSSSCVQPGNIDSLLSVSGVDSHESSVLKCFELYKNDSSEEMVEVCVKKSVPSKLEERVYFYTGDHSFTCTRQTMHSSLDER
jgi:hypothetical protein